MIKEIQNLPGNSLALEVQNAYTAEDEKKAQQLFEKKLEQGFSQINVLVKVEEVDENSSNTKALVDDMIWTLRHFKQMKHLAIVASSPDLQKLVPQDNLFFKRFCDGRLEKYFDASELNEAVDFLESSEN